MPRIAGVTIPSDKRIETSLTYVYGIGLHKSQEILSKLQIDPNIRAHALTEEQLDQIRSLLETSGPIEGDLRREISTNIKRLRDINSYRGSRHAKKLPANGQRTKTNARTRRGRRVTVGSGRKIAASKT